MKSTDAGRVPQEAEAALDAAISRGASHDELYELDARTQSAELALSEADDKAPETFTTELPEADLIRFAVEQYAGKGYEDVSECLFALLADVARLHVNKTRTPGVARHITLEGALADLDENLAPERYLEDA